MLTAQIVAVLGTVITGVTVFLVTERLKRRADLFWYILPKASFPLPNEEGKPAAQINSEIVVMQNLGGATAEDVEIILAHQPKAWEFRVFPNRHFAAEIISEGHCSIKLGALGAKEVMQIMVMYGQIAPAIIQVRTKSGFCPASQYNIRRAEPPWLVRTLVAFFGLGFFVFVVAALTATIALAQIIYEFVVEVIPPQ